MQLRLRVQTTFFLSHQNYSFDQKCTHGVRHGHRLAVHCNLTTKAVPDPFYNRFAKLDWERHGQFTSHAVRNSPYPSLAANESNSWQHSLQSFKGPLLEGIMTWEHRVATPTHIRTTPFNYYQNKRSLSPDCTPPRSSSRH